MSQIVSTGTEIEDGHIQRMPGVSHLLIRQRPAARNDIGVALPALKKHTKRFARRAADQIRCCSPREYL